MPLFRLASLVAVVLLVAFAGAVYDALPDRIPSHFDFSGAATTFRARTVWSWFDLPLIGVACWALLAGVSRALPSHPHLFNFPEKERFLKLPREYHAPVVAQMQAMLDLVALSTALLFLGIQVMAWRVAMGGESGAFGYLPLVALLVVPLVPLVWLPRLNRAVEEQERRWKQATS